MQWGRGFYVIKHYLTGGLCRVRSILKEPAQDNFQVIKHALPEEKMKLSGDGRTLGFTQIPIAKLCSGL
jgi:hypothetical protein